MTQLTWRRDWHLGIEALDKQHANIVSLINECAVLIEYSKQSEHISEPVGDIAEAKQHFSNKKINTLIDDLFLPLICNLKSEIAVCFDTLESTDKKLTDNNNYHFYKKDYMMLMTELKQYIHFVRIDGVLDSVCVQQIRIWFIMHMRCLKRMTGSFSLLEQHRIVAI